METLFSPIPKSIQEMIVFDTNVKLDPNVLLLPSHDLLLWVIANLKDDKIPLRRIHNLFYILKKELQQIQCALEYKFEEETFAGKYDPVLQNHIEIWLVSRCLAVYKDKDSKNHTKPRLIQLTRTGFRYATNCATSILEKIMESEKFNNMKRILYEIDELNEKELYEKAAYQK